MRRWWKRLGWGSCVTAVGLAGGVYAGLTPDQWAAWVQALGSIGAILVAIAVSRDQSVDQRLRDEAVRIESEARTIEAVEQLVEQASAYTEMIKALTIRESDVSHWRSVSVQCQELLDHYRSIPTLAIPDADLIRLSMLIRQLLITYIGNLSVDVGKSNMLEVRARLAEFAAGSDETVQEARARCKQLMNEKRDSLRSLRALG